MSQTSISNDTLLAQLRWRYATKAFDPAKKISAADWSALEEALILSPSSYGMQPYHFFVITDPATREKLVPASWNQRQPADCSHYVVFAVRTANTEADVDEYMARIAEVRGRTADAMGSFKGMLMGDVVNGARGKAATEWAARQAYIALGNFMTAAALVGIDTCPMEGFVPPQYDEILGLKEKGLTAAVACAAGYRAASDKYASLPKVRFPASKLIVHI
ncbi:MAG: NAD(P)H-dependent oxidoreductase [Chthoniobacteraceae bacterium]